jgi:hypothetical protein
MFTRVAAIETGTIPVVYELVLATHQWIGWAAVATAAAAMVTASRRSGHPLERWAVRSAAVALVALAATGVCLYFGLSPFTAGLRANIDVALHDPTLRYWNVVHPLTGVAALGLLAWYRRLQGSRQLSFVVAAGLVAATTFTALSWPL